MILQKQPVAIIPARGGSKRLPHKNILPLEGRPMIVHPIQTAIESGLFSNVYVSTEDIEIANIAKRHGAEIIQRPDSLADDISGVDDVLMHVLATLEADDKLPEMFCCLYATAALLVVEDLIRSRELMELTPKADFVMGVSAYDIHPFKAMDTNEDSFLYPLWPKENMERSQTYPRYFASNGTLYWGRTTAFRENGSFYGSRLRGYEVPPSRAVDLDTEEDYLRMRVYAKTRSVPQD